MGADAAVAEAFPPCMRRGCSMTTPSVASRENSRGGDAMADSHDFSCSASGSGSRSSNAMEQCHQNGVSGA